MPFASVTPAAGVKAKSDPGSGSSSPPAPTETAPQPQRPASPWLAGLLGLESDLDAAIEAVVDFVNAPPRQAGALASAEELDRLVPENRRGPAYAAFVNSVETGADPAQLQELAEAVGVDLTAQLASVRREINPGG